VKEPKLIKATGEEEEIIPEDGSFFSLKELYSLLNCSLVELVNVNRDYIMIVDEEGRLTGKPINEKASDLVKDRYDFIVGDVIVCHQNYFK
jgi:hypothetical protein